MRWRSRKAAAVLPSVKFLPRERAEILLLALGKTNRGAADAGTLTGKMRGAGSHSERGVPSWLWMTGPWLLQKQLGWH